MAEVNVMGRIKLNQAVANLDAKYGPYTSKEQAYETLGVNNMDVLAEGLTVGIIEGGKIVEYWFQGGIALENLVRKSTKIVVDLKDYNTTAGHNIIPAPAKDCQFIYDNEAVYVVPNLYNNESCILAYVCVIKNSQLIDKVFIISGVEVIQMWEGNEKPDWVLKYIPDGIATLITNIKESLDEIDACITWNIDEDESI